MLAIAAFWFWRMKRRNAKATALNHRSNVENFQDSKPNGSEVKSPQELQGYIAVPEIGSGTMPQEIAGGEVDGSRPSTARVHPFTPVELA
jgi:hypothetical protein